MRGNSLYHLCGLFYDKMLNDEFRESGHELLEVFNPRGCGKSGKTLTRIASVSSEIRTEQVLNTNLRILQEKHPA
jgi:hypothetical protein